MDTEQWVSAQHFDVPATLPFWPYHDFTSRPASVPMDQPPAAAINTTVPLFCKSARSELTVRSNVNSPRTQLSELIEGIVLGLAVSPLASVIHYGTMNINQRKRRDCTCVRPQSISKRATEEQHTEPLERRGKANGFGVFRVRRS